MIQLSYKPYTLLKKHVFRIAGGARTSTPAVLVRLRFEGAEGFGEASMPPLYGESIASATGFLSQVDLSVFKDPLRTEDILGYIDDIAPGNPAVKAAVDIALHDLVGKLLGMPVHRYFGLSERSLPTSKTIGIDRPDIIRERVREASGFRYLKIKLGGDNDRGIIEAVRRETDKPLYIDANQGWKDRGEALEKILWLREEGAVFIEQPMPKTAFSDMEWLAPQSPLPLVGDEGIQRIPDVMTAKNFYHGINIKLMKSTGLREAFIMAMTARKAGLRVMLGCMSETSCAIAAASQLGALADWTDLDGNLGITNDPFDGHLLRDGLITQNKRPGIGLKTPEWEKIKADEQKTS
ncbi:dipeptide epimerase [Sinomicrobium soli]|uniref:dipeptide epimerase n=1 Tax=Sinomicrobium sp. N-1-3-6 TaxID=2219864 RepID=UPI000DCBABE4|nr:dipeptide epimerase [Sinomicrobium sp. N-1-3-6]RAV28879.1 dipeptide epimerase [Sinomicrobium sp. N-1-3-6]